MLTIVHIYMVPGAIAFSTALPTTTAPQLGGATDRSTPYYTKHISPRIFMVNISAPS